MSHLSSPLSIGAMIFYSLLTFFIMPFITTPLLPGNSPDKCVEVLPLDLQLVYSYG